MPLDSVNAKTTGTERPFALLADSRLRAVSARLSSLCHLWCADWGFYDAAFTIECVRAWESPILTDFTDLTSAGWQRSYGVDGAMAWMAWQADFERQLQRCMFAPDRIDSSATVTGIAASAARQALQDLVGRMAILAELGVENVKPKMHPPASFLAYASGALLITVTVSGQALTCLFGCPCLESLVGQSDVNVTKLSVLTQRKQAIGNVPLRLMVEAGQAEVTVGNLMILAIGDVIRLNRSIDAPLSVQIPPGQRLFDAHLGKRGDMMALEVA
jgi:flagellar motor switch/type III secretory pathway protein FliN